MKSILLIGLGRFGKHVAMHLHNLGHQVMAVDSTEERVNAVLPYVTEAQIGDSTNESFLSSLGIRNFDACIVAIGDNFQSSLETTSLLKELGAKLVVSRASSDVHQKFLLRNGADQVVYPEQQLAKWTAIRFSSNHILDFVNLEGDYDIYEVDLPERWVGMSVGEIDIRKKYGINIIAVRRNGTLDFSGKKVVAVVSGGNIDVNTISRIIERGLIKTGRRTTLATTVQDRPGQLARLVEAVAAQGVNVLSINHDRNRSRLELGEAQVELVLETNDRDHIARIKGSLEKLGYEVEEID